MRSAARDLHFTSADPSLCFGRWKPQEKRVTSRSWRYTLSPRFMRWLKTVTLIVATVHLAGSARAQASTAQPIAANRPGYIEATGTLARGQFQVEFSGNVDDFSPTDRSWSEPFHVRLGVTNRLELRVHGNGVQRLIG